MVISNFRDEELIKVQGKQYPLVGGRLRLAHEGNKQLSISTSLISMTDDRVIIQANIETEKGKFSGLGNASAKRDKLLANALVELAETRAIARALRFAGYGMEYTGFEEMPDDVKESTEMPEAAALASRAQLEAIASSAKRNNLSSKQLHDIMLKTTGKEKSRELTAEDVSKLMLALRKIEKQDNSKIS
jgi:hypothetical protein